MSSLSKYFILKVLLRLSVFFRRSDENNIVFYNQSFSIAQRIRGWVGQARPHSATTKQVHKNWTSKEGSCSTSSSCSGEYRWKLRWQCARCVVLDLLLLLVTLYIQRGILLNKLENETVLSGNVKVHEKKEISEKCLFRQIVTRLFSSWNIKNHVKHLTWWLLV